MGAVRMLLRRDELVALAASARVMMLADGEVSEGELQIISSFAGKLGLTEDEWEDIWDEGVRTLPNQAAIEAAARIQRPGAREVVYEMLYVLATDGTIVDAEWDILEWLDETWMAERDFSSS